MSMTLNDDFKRDGYNIVSCHSPLVLEILIANTSTSMASGDATATIQGQSPTENTTAYTFEMGYVETTGSGPTYYHTFRLDITDIIREICNDPDLDLDAQYIMSPVHRNASKIQVTIASSPETPVNFTNFYAHGFNQVNDQNSSCLVPLGDGSALIPVVAGAPMAHYLYLTSTSVSSSWSAQLERDSSIVWTGSSGLVSTGQGMAQIYEDDLNEDLHNDFPGVPSEYVLSVIYSTATYGTITLLAMREACEGDVLLAWLNRFGTYSYMVFDRFPITRGSQKHIGSRDILIDDLADVQSRTKSRGFSNVKDTISAVAKNIPTEYFYLIEDLFYSMDVYYFTGTLPSYVFDEEDWLRVQVRGNLQERAKYNQENVRVDIILPEKYTQQR